MLFSAGGSSDCDDDNAVMCWTSCTVGPVCGAMETAYCVDPVNNEVVDGTVMCPSTGDDAAHSVLFSFIQAPSDHQHTGASFDSLSKLFLTISAWPCIHITT